MFNFCGAEEKKGKQGSNCGEEVAVDQMKKDKEEEKSSEE
jgi:hypothetical protein